MASPKIDRRPIVAVVDKVLNAPAAVYAASPIYFGVATFVVYVLVVLGMAVAKPAIGWDALAYIALAKEHVLTSAAALHDFAYAAIKAAISPADFTGLTDDGGYRSAMYADTPGFISMLGMYRIKFLYIELLTTLSNFMSPVMAGRLISLGSAAVFGLVALAWLRLYKALGLAPLFVGLLIVAGFSDMATMFSPDTLFSAVFLTGLLAYVCRHDFVAAALLFLAFLVRPDNLIFLGIFSALLVFYRQFSWSVLLAFLAAAVTFFPLAAFTGQPGWWTQIYFASVEKQMTLDGFHAPFSVVLYLTALVKQALLALTLQTWVGVLLLALVGWFAVRRANVAVPKRELALTSALFLSIAAKFALLPIYDARIYFPYLIALCLLLAGPLTQWARSLVLAKAVPS